MWCKTVLELPLSASPLDTSHEIKVQLPSPNSTSSCALHSSPQALFKSTMATWAAKTTLLESWTLFFFIYTQTVSGAKERRSLWIEWRAYFLSSDSVSSVVWQVRLWTTVCSDGELKSKTNDRFISPQSPSFHTCEGNWHSSFKSLFAFIFLPLKCMLLYLHLLTL